MRSLFSAFLLLPLIFLRLPVKADDTCAKTEIKATSSRPVHPSTSNIQTVNKAPLGCLHETSTQAGQELNGPASLLFNADHYLYIHESAPMRDSSLSKENYISFHIAGDPEGFPIYKRHRERTMTCRITCLF